MNQPIIAVDIDDVLADEAEFVVEYTNLYRLRQGEFGVIDQINRDRLGIMVFETGYRGDV